MTPTQLYSERLGARERSCAGLERLFARIGAVRLALAAVFLLLAWACGARGLPAGWLLAPAIAFVAAVICHHRVRRRRDLARRGVVFYRTGLERLQGQQHDPGPAGVRFHEEHHLYGTDLDLFGPQSLFARLCTARTPMGRSTLARWLLQPADLQTIRVRQECIAELRRRPDLREDLLLLGETVPIAVQPGAITAWAMAADALPGPLLRAAALLLAAAAVGTALLWAVRGVEFAFLAVLAIEAGLNYRMRNPVQAAVAGVEHAHEEIKLLAVLLRRIEAESFDAAPLRALQARLRSGAARDAAGGPDAATAAAAAPPPTASALLAQLATRVNFVEARRNPLLVPVMLPLLYTLHSALAAERWRRRHGRAVAAWLDVLAEIEALASIAAYSFERPADPFPEFIDGAPAFVATGLGHPLLAAAACVRNDVNLADARVLLVSGSNMSGKSTLLRAVGINTVLAMAGAPVCAERLRLTPLQIGASIQVNDSLQEGSSRFYAEIKRLRQLFEPAAFPLLFLLDELLQGTNSKDRRIGARGVLQALLRRGAIGLISTHDLALNEGADFAGALKNVHFQDELIHGRLHFDYKLREGVVTKSNGIELMRAIGLEV